MRYVLYILYEMRYSEICFFLKKRVDLHQITADFKSQLETFMHIPNLCGAPFQENVSNINLSECQNERINE